MDVATRAGLAVAVTGVSGDAEGPGVVEGRPSDGTIPALSEDLPQAATGSSKHSTNAKTHPLTIVCLISTPPIVPPSRVDGRHSDYVQCTSLLIANRGMDVWCRYQVKSSRTATASTRSLRKPVPHPFHASATFATSRCRSCSLGVV